MKRIVAILCLSAATVVAPATAQAPTTPEMLQNLDRGQWEIRFRDGSDPVKICVRSGWELIQLRHRRFSCGRTVVEDGKNQVTVQYSCGNNGYGRTSLRRETRTLLQIDGQGLVGSSPFQFSAEARRIGACG